MKNVNNLINRMVVSIAPLDQNIQRELLGTFKEGLNKT